MNKKIIYILLLSLLFGIFQSYIIHFDLKQIIVSSVLPIVFTIPFLLIYCTYLYIKGNLKSSETIDNIWKAFKPIVLICITITILDLLGTIFKKDKIKNETKDAYLQKSKVIKEYVNPYKNIRSTTFHSLTKDSLYENFDYHYSILFTKGYRLNYDIKKYSQIQAFDDKNGNSITISAKPSDKIINSDFNIEKTDGSKELTSLSLINFKTPVKRANFEKSICEMGYKNVNIKTMELISFADSYFIKFTIDSKVLYREKEYPVKLVIFSTYNLNNIYTITFKSSAINYNQDWRKFINQTMANFVVSKSILNE